MEYWEVLIRSVYFCMAETGCSFHNNAGVRNINAEVPQLSAVLLGKRYLESLGMLLRVGNVLRCEEL